MPDLEWDRVGDDLVAYSPTYSNGERCCGVIGAHEPGNHTELIGPAFEPWPRQISALRFNEIPIDPGTAPVPNMEIERLVDRMREEIRRHLDGDVGCCTSCGGTGTSQDTPTGGLCWDCKGTGHGHDPECPCTA